MSFAKECEQAHTQGRSCDKIATQREVWQVPIPVDGIELQWHLTNLLKNGIECDNPISWLLVALTSINAWSQLALSIPWIGRYTLRDGVSYRVMHYFCSRIPIYKSFMDNTMTFSRSFNGRLHGLFFRCNVIKMRHRGHTHDTIYYPWEYSEDRDEFPYANTEMCLWDRGRKVRHPELVTGFTYQIKPLSKYGVLYIRFGDRTAGKVLIMVIYSGQIFNCRLCNLPQMECRVSLVGDSISYIICPECRYAVRYIFRYNLEKVRSSRTALSFENIRLLRYL